ncbi:MAG TPA: ABC transporter substrate-binding protein [Gaiellaceae bacterium]|jgi:peptide/nickel transport system substrate-binding protein
MSHEPGNSDAGSPEEPNTHTRRDVVKRGARVAGVAVLAPGVLTGAAQAAVDRHLAARRLGRAAAGGTLTVAQPGEPKTLDPHRSTLDVFRHSIRSAVFDSLTWVDPATLAVQPKLAKSWTVSKNGKTVVFKLQEGVKWHDGTPFTASDVAFTIKRVKDPKIASQFAPQVATVKSVDVVDDTTVRFNLSASTPPLFANLLQVQIVGENSIGSIETKPIGTGPFKFVEFVPGDHQTLEKNTDYWVQGTPLLDQLIFKNVPDAQSRLAQLRAGSVQMIDGIDPKDVKQAKSFPNAYVFTSKPVNLYEIFQINTKRKPFDDKRVRQALSYAFDRKSYLKNFWYGLARQSSGPFVKEMPAYLPGVDNAYKFDLKKAASLLQQAGFTKAKPLEIEILSIVGYPTLKAMAVILQANLNKIGMKATITELEISPWIDRIATHPDFDITVDNYNTVPEDPAGMFNSDNLAPAGNINQWNPPGYAALVAKAASEQNPRKRNALYRQLQKLILTEQPFITIDHYPIIVAAAKTVKGVKLGPSGIYDWSRATV